MKIHYIKCLRMIRSVKISQGKGAGVEGIGMLILNSIIRDGLIKKMAVKQI